MAESGAGYASTHPAVVMDSTPPPPIPAGTCLESLQFCAARLLSHPSVVVTSGVADLNHSAVVLVIMILIVTVIIWTPLSPTP